VRDCAAGSKLGIGVQLRLGRLNLSRSVGSALYCVWLSVCTTVGSVDVLSPRLRSPVSSRHYCVRVLRMWLLCRRVGVFGAFFPLGFSGVSFWLFCRGRVEFIRLSVSVEGV